MQGLRRLTRLDVRSVEEIVDVDSDEMFDWPFLYAVGIGDWVVSDSQATRLRHYFDRGGFLMVDDFHNEREFASFMAGVHKIFPGAEAVELEDDAPIFHVVYNMSRRLQVPGLNVGARTRLRTRRCRAPLARNSGWEGTCPDSDLPQHGSGRRLGVGGSARISRKVRFRSVPARRQLCPLHYDSLTKEQA